MGREAQCAARIGREATTGKLLLETDELIFRGKPRLVVPLAAIRAASAKDGWLHVTHAAGTARFELGDGAEKWAYAINHPRTRMDKLDVKPASKVALVGLDDDEFAREVRARAASVATRASGRAYDLLFYRADAPRALARLPALRERITPAGAVWIITPKGRPELGHGPVVAAAKAAGLVDVKTARFSATHTALKLMIPRAKR